MALHRCCISIYIPPRLRNSKKGTHTHTQERGKSFSVCLSSKLYGCFSICGFEKETLGAEDLFLFFSRDASGALNVDSFYIIFS